MQTEPVLGSSSMGCVLHTSAQHRKEADLDDRLSGQLPAERGGGGEAPTSVAQIVVVRELDHARPK